MLKKTDKHMKETRCGRCETVVAKPGPYGVIHVPACWDDPWLPASHRIAALLALKD